MKEKSNWMSIITVGTKISLRKTGINDPNQDCGHPGLRVSMNVSLRVHHPHPSQTPPQCP